MNEITMIPVGLLEHHPENPRKDLGDLTELTDSIKKNGIMQNLTVIADPETSKYLVVIGNRRLEAAKAAGLIELPCVVKDLDHKTQISTMLEENMQRQDLTIFEQAQGFQMMMDLGYSAADIAEKTGFGETTVRRRLKMAEMDPKLLKKACEAKDTERQITLFDFDRLAQVNSIKERNTLLKGIGDRDFEWSLTRALRVQQSNAVKKDAKKALEEAKATPIKKEERYSGKYEQLWGKTIKLYEWKPGTKIAPKSEDPLFYDMDDTQVDFYIKRKPQPREKPMEKSEEEKEEDRRRDLAWKTVDRYAETSADLRARFAEGMTVSPKNCMRMMQWALVAAFTSMLDYDTPTMMVTKKLECKEMNIPDTVEHTAKKLMELPQSKWPNLILMMFEGDWEEHKQKAPNFAEGRRSWQFPKHDKNPRLALCYEWLTEFGYQMSTEEVEMMAGTHDCFAKD